MIEHRPQKFTKRKEKYTKRILQIYLRHGKMTLERFELVFAVIPKVKQINIFPYLIFFFF